MFSTLIKKIKLIVLKFGMNFIFLIGFIGILASLYFSEYLKLPPCDLCWYQRVLFYPIPIIALISIITKDTKANLYIFILALIGLPISIYHHLLKVTNVFAKDTIFCNTEGACSKLDWELISGTGITIPFLSMLGFLGVIVITGMYYYCKKSIGNKLLDK